MEEPEAGVEINFIYDPNVSAFGSAEAGFEAALNVAAAYLDNLIINPITVNISVGWGEIGGRPIPAGAAAEGGLNQLMLVSYDQLSRSFH